MLIDFCMTSATPFQLTPPQQHQPNPDPKPYPLPNDYLIHIVHTEICQQMSHIMVNWGLNCHNIPAIQYHGTKAFTL